MAADEEITPDREDFDQVRDEYCAAHDCTPEEYSLALMNDRFVGEQYRLAQARKLLRLYGTKPDAAGH